MGPVSAHGNSIERQYSASYNAALYGESPHQQPTNHLLQGSRPHLSSFPLHTPHDLSSSSSSSYTDLDVSIVSEMYSKAPNAPAAPSSMSESPHHTSQSSSPSGGHGSSSGTPSSPPTLSTSTPRSSPSPMGSPHNNLRSTPRSSPIPSPIPSPLCSPRDKLRSTPRGSPSNSPTSSPRSTPVKALRPAAAPTAVPERAVAERAVAEKADRDTSLSEPLHTTRLKPIRQRTKNAVISILDDGFVVLELIRQKDGVDRVIEVIKISPNGEKVEVYQPCTGCVLQDQPPTPGRPSRVYPLHQLPPRYWRRYQYAARFVWLIRSKTPKVILYTRTAKCLLMENAPSADCDVIFYDGSRYSYACREWRLQLTDGTVLVLEEPAAWRHLTPATRRAWQYAQQIHIRCLELEALLTPLNQRNSDVIYFPVTVGRRPNTLSISATSGTLATSGSEGIKTPTKGAQHRRAWSPVGSLSTPDKTICPSPSSARSQSPITTLDDTMVNQFSTPIASRLARQGARRRSRSVDPSVQLHMTETYNDVTKRQRHASGSVSPRSRPAWEQERREAWEISDVAAPPVMTSPVMTSSQADVMSSVLVPDVGRGTLLSNGEVLMEFSDGTALSLQSAPCMVVRYRDVDGSTTRYDETDQLPTHVKHKLEALPYVMSHLEAVQANKPQRHMTP